MTARVVILAMLAVALVAGAAMYWLQVHAFYREVPEAEAGPVTLVLDGESVPLQTADFRAIDAESSPIRYRACFTTPAPVEALAPYERYPEAKPLNAPGWFDCFDAEEVGRALEAGEAAAFLSVEDVRYGIDRVVALLPGGRGVAWNQINRCGDAVFNGDPPPEGCAPPPAGARLNYSPDEA
jgi:hypothetical protein